MDSTRVFCFAPGCVKLHHKMSRETPQVILLVVSLGGDKICMTWCIKVSHKMMVKCWSNLFSVLGVPYSCSLSTIALWEKMIHSSEP